MSAWRRLAYLVTIVAGAAGLASYLETLRPRPAAPGSSHGRDGFRKNLFRGVLPRATTMSMLAMPTAYAQTSVGPSGPTSSGGLFTSVVTLADGGILNNDECLTIGTTDSTASPCIRYDTTQTVDAGMLLTGTVGNAWVIAERQDEAFDFAHAQATNPTLFIHSAAQSTSEFLSLAHNGTAAVIATPGALSFVPNTSQVSAYTPNNTAWNFAVGTHVGWASGDPSATSADTGLVRYAAGRVRSSNGSSGLGYFLSGHLVTANTGTATPAIIDSGTIYTNTGDADGSQVTLPNDPTIGTTFTIVGTAAFNITVAPSAGETVMFGNTVCATSFIVSGVASGIGDSATVVAATGGSGAVWITTASAGTPVCTS